jgi:uncharacterized OB-fold protein
VTTSSSFAPPDATAIGAEHFLTDGTRVVLRVTRCTECGQAWFPARAQCSNCASRNVIEELTSSAGTTYACTVVQIGPARFHPPYALAYVDVDGVRLLVHVAGSTAALVPGTPVDLVLAPIGSDDRGPLLSYAVTASTRTGA